MSKNAAPTPTPETAGTAPAPVATEPPPPVAKAAKAAKAPKKLKPRVAEALPAPAGGTGAATAAPAAGKAGKTAKVTKAAKEKKVAVPKEKLVRDSFTFPATDYARIGALKQRVLKTGREVKKSEILRAALAALAALPDADLLQTLDGIDRLKPGRPAA